MDILHLILCDKFKDLGVNGEIIYDFHYVFLISFACFVYENQPANKLNDLDFTFQCHPR